MCKLMRVVHLFGHKPLVHLLYFVLGVPLLSLRQMQQLLTHLRLRLLDKFTFEAALGILMTQPLLIVHLWFKRNTMRFLVHFVVKFIGTIGSHFTLCVNSFKFFLVDLKPVL